MTKKETAEGIVQEALPDLRFRVLLDDGRLMIAYTAGKMVRNKIKVIVGDRVVVEPDPYHGKATNRLVRRK